MVALSSSGKLRTKLRTLQESFVKEIECAAAKPVLPWLFSGWGPLSMGLGKVTQGRAAKRESAGPLHGGSLQTYTAATANAICLLEYLSEGVDSLFCIDVAWWQLLCSELGAAGTWKDAEVGLAAGLGSRASRNFLDLP